MEKYNIGIYVEGQIEVHEFSDPDEEAQNIATQIITYSDLLWPSIHIELLQPVVESDKEEEFTSP